MHEADEVEVYGSPGRLRKILIIVISEPLFCTRDKGESILIGTSPPSCSMQICNYMIHTRCMKNLIVLIVAATLILPISAYEAHAVPLGTLVGGSVSIQVGDLLFNHFSFLPVVNHLGGNFSPNNPGDIDIQSISLAGESGLRVSGPFMAAGDGGQASLSQYSIAYDITTTNPALLLHGVRLSIASSETGQASAMLGISTPIGATSGMLVAASPNVSTFSAFVADAITTHVIESSSLNSADGTITISSIDVTFAQISSPVSSLEMVTNPEPATWLLLGSGILGFAFARRTLAVF
jgi:hypothetical protein